MLGRFSLVTGIIFLFIMVSCKLSFGQITQNDLRKYTEYALINNLIEYDPPKLDWDVSGVNYDLGGTSECISIEDELITIPLREQFIVTGIRLHRTESQQRRFWRPVLERVEGEITKMLNIIQKNNNDPELYQKEIVYYRKQINLIYFQALDKLAREDRGGKAINTGESKPCAAHVTKVLIDPTSGQLERISAGEWSYYLFFKDKRQILKPQWESIPTGDEVYLYGKNWIHATWPNSRGWVKLIEFGTMEMITITPNGPK